mmetsp:Transcript_1201/g.1726  ORF Transcript_1201/g.1726 Transcript_1201/m.1726 type:complete len:613 (-) Transcript_1201:415-2253(-)|eukprot:CAMPEP_0116035436 /NCGR_PEP_ID=MMETSP0321-20121206/20366_1 /TAXON_ID=163516 /ORGANISM="Leptocylindrus danicus var. danicus, Strain B650" /LENGTH=612 /DNA_ID=CAMNT_0003512267 /DNA_START=2221 /DNA_END=4059 /DNA_ORIENTATION=+
MPVTGVYTWTQTDCTVELSIPLKGASLKTVDVYLADTFLKVNYHPFLLEIDLHRRVNNSRSTALSKNGHLVIVLMKMHKEQWESIEFVGDEDAVKKRRSDAIAKHTAEMKELHEKAKEKKVEEGRMVLRRQMDLEQAERHHIDMAKEKEKRDAEAELYAAFEGSENGGVKSITSVTTLVGEEDHAIPGATTQQATKNSKQNDDFSEQSLGGTNEVSSKSNATTFSSITCIDECEPQSEKINAENNIRLKIAQSSELKKIDDPTININAPRSAVKATFKYTPRLFKTPSRESTISQEEMFVIKNRPFLKTNLLLNKDGLDISDADPLWLKTKGDEFYCCGDFLSAVHAYSSALACDKSMAQALSNRAACYIHLGEPLLCIKDCTQVLKWCDDSENDDELRKKILVRRGAASCQLGDYGGCLKDYEVATNIKSLSTNIELRNDLLAVRQIAQADALKREADELLSQGNNEEALVLYNKTVDAVPTFVRALSNRGICSMTIGNMSDCIGDCSTIIGLLNESRREAQNGELNSFRSQQFGFNLIPSKNSEEWRLCLAKALSRRGIAKAQLHEFEGALKDLREGLNHVNTENCKDREDLEKDICAIQKMAQDHVTEP